MERSMHSLAQKSRKRIVDSLICLLGKKSYESITVSELCRKAQVDRRTFYRNFKNKEDVMEFHIQEAMAGKVTPEEALANMEQEFIDEMAKVEN